MKNLKVFLISMLLSALTLVGTLVLAGEQQKVTLRVDGLACPFCAYGMEKKLERIENLEKLEIKINNGLVILYFKEGAKIDKELISEKVEEAGFTPKELQIESAPREVAKGQKISLNIQGMACERCVLRVTKALSDVECASDVQVSLEKEQATLVCSDPKTDKAKFVETVEKLGFEAEVAK